MNKNSVSEFVEKFVTKIDEKRKSFTLKQLDIITKFTTAEVTEAIKRIHDHILNGKAAKVENTKHDKELGEFTVFLNDGFRYVVVENNGKPIIDDILLPCDCSEEEDTVGKCLMCVGNGTVDDEDTECPMCEGEGICANCDGEGVIRLSSGMGEAMDYPEEKPLADKEQLLNEVEEEFENLDVAKMVAEYLYELDKLYFSNYSEFQQIYKESFDPETLDYPEVIFPAYFTPFMDNFTMESDGKYYGVAELGGDSLLLTIEEIDDKFVIIKMETECSMADGAPELHNDIALQCQCAEYTTDGTPDEDCENCHGTGVIVCPICLGAEWIELAPNTLHPEDIDDPKRYQKGIKDLYGEELKQ